MTGLRVELERLLQTRAQNGQSLTLVTGVFDVLHDEHRRFLLAAKALGDLLIVGLESDERVRQLKGEGRPINTLNHRLEHLRAWAIADLVFALPTDFAKPELRQELLELIRPDYLAVSSHTPNLAVKKQLLKSVGGEVRVVRQFQPAFSSSKLIAKAIQK